MDTKIYFCDLCNESIPQEDLEKSRVTTVRGKMICAKCVPPPGGAAPGASGAAAPGSSGSGALFGLVAIVLGGAGLFVAMQTKARVEAQPTNLPAKIADVEKVVDRLAEDLSNSSKRTETLVARLAKVEAEPGAIREALADQLHRVEAEERASRDAKTKIDWLSSGRDQTEKLALTQQGLERDVAELKSTVQALATRLSALAAAPPPAPSGGDAAGAATPKDEGPKFDAETKALLTEITNKDSVKRWLAVEKLRKKHDPNLIPYLLPLLDDSDAFVQFNTITALRELNARSAVGKLVKLLRDPNKTVHEEAQEALVTLTGNTQLHFDIVNGTPAEREKGIKAWEEWYAKNKERFAEPAASS